MKKTILIAVGIALIFFGLTLITISALAIWGDSFSNNPEGKCIVSDVKETSGQCTDIDGENPYPCIHVQYTISPYGDFDCIKSTSSYSESENFENPEGKIWTCWNINEYCQSSSSYNKGAIVGWFAGIFIGLLSLMGACVSFCMIKMTSMSVF